MYSSDFLDHPSHDVLPTPALSSRLINPNIFHEQVSIVDEEHSESSLQCISEAEMMMMTFSIRHKLSRIAIDDLLKLMRLVSPDVFIGKEHCKSADGMFEKIIGQGGYDIKFICEDCGKSKEEFVPCLSCGNEKEPSDDSNFYATFDLKNILEDR
eukprot:Pompholyxophrys_sp_v1_NODE_99_length_1999_cov_3.948586.p1 type:complete len:155 gc:universal NODE_99_length_1999_cov_3.948586:1008-1472(+)